MPEWMEYGLEIFVGAVAIMLLIKYRDRGVLKRIGESKYQFRQWIVSGGATSSPDAPVPARHPRLV